MLYAISTAGSFVGTLVSGFWLIPWLGLSRLLACTAALLALLAGAYFGGVRRWVLAGTAVVGALAWPLVVAHRTTAGPSKGDGWQLLANRDGLYGQLKVCQLGNAERRMLIDGINQGAIHWPACTPASRYVYVVEALAKAAVPEARSALVVGLGTGLVPNVLHGLGIAAEVVEIDPLVAELQQSFFQPPGNSFPVHLADARRYIATCDRSFDLIVMDAFSGDSVPAHLLSRESFAQFAERVQPNGAVILNLVTVVGGGETRALSSVVRTMQEVFPTVRPFCWHGPAGRRAAVNVLILALKAERPVDIANQINLATGPLSWYTQMALGNELEVSADEALVLTDDHNPIDLFLTESAEIWRHDILAGESVDLLLR
jgi:predicted membrane-bound spermidine synthase